MKVKSCVKLNCPTPIKCSNLVVMVNMLLFLV